MLRPRLLEAERTISLSVHPDFRMLMAMILDDHRTKSYEQAVQFCRDLLARPGLEEVAEEMRRPRADGGEPESATFL